MHIAHNSKFGSLEDFSHPLFRGSVEMTAQIPESPAESPVNQASPADVFKLPAANSSGDCEGRGGSVVGGTSPGWNADSIPLQP